MRYSVVAEHTESCSFFRVMDSAHPQNGNEAIVGGWNTEDTPNAAWLAQDFCDRWNANPKWSKFRYNMLPILGVTWHRFDTEDEASAFVEWAEFVTKDYDHPCEAFVMGKDSTGVEVKVRNW